MSSHLSSTPRRARLPRLATTLVALALAGLGLAAADASAIKLPKQQKPGELAILLQLKHPKGLGNFVRSVSDPKSPEYGEYLTVEQIAQRFGAKKSAKQATMQWLRGARRPRSPQSRPAPTSPPACPPRSPPRRDPRIGASPPPPVRSDARRVPASLRGAVTAVETVGTEEGAFYKNVVRPPSHPASARRPASAAAPSCSTPAPRKAAKPAANSTIRSKASTN